MTDEEFELNKNQIEMLEFLEDARSSEEHPINLKTVFGFKTHHNESEAQIQKHKDYLEISSHGHHFIAEKVKDGDWGWITKAGKEALAKFKAEEKKKKESAVSK